MKSTPLCLLAALISTFTFGQSSRVPVVGQRNGIATPTPRLSRRLPFGQRKTAGKPQTSAATASSVSQDWKLNFAPPVLYGSGGSGAASFVLSDVNGDGKPDILVRNGDGSIGVLLGSGDGTFQAEVIYGTGGSGAATFEIADVNLDGKPDIVVVQTVSANDASGLVGALLGNGDGTFQAAVTYSSGAYGPVSIAVADVNLDGKPDIVVNQMVSANDASGLVGVLLGNGDGSFQTAMTYGSGGYPGEISVADLNQDGKPDIVAAIVCSPVDCYGWPDGAAGVLLGNGDGTFQTAVTYDSGAFFAHLSAIADLNGDGRLDLVLHNFASMFSSPFYIDPVFGVLLANGDGTFQAATYSMGGEESGSSAIADLNGDGRPDLVAANNCSSFNRMGCTGGGTIGVLLGNGDGTFPPAVIYDSGGSDARSVAVADMNKDGKPDLVVGNNWMPNSNESGSIGVLLGDGDGTFQTAVTYSMGGVWVSPIAVSDLNGDGKSDVVARVITNGQGTVAVLINVGGAATTMELVSSLNPSNSDQPVTFTATVAPQGEGTPTGTVTFFDGTTKLGNFTLAGGASSLTVSTLAVGHHSITAVYSGDKDFAQNTSTAVSQLVQGGQPAAVLTPSLLDFGGQAFNTMSAPQNLTLTNTAYTPLSISSIGIIGTNSSDFAQSNNCGTSLPISGSCNISVTFTPAGVGSAMASLNVTDNVPGSPQSVSLSGTGWGASVGLSPSSMTFVNQYVGTSGLPQTLTVTNTGNEVLTISTVTSSVADFGTLSNCTNPVDPGLNCTIGVFFDPTASGTRTGTLLIHDNAVGNPHSVSLSGTGQDFSLASSSSSTANITAGQTANYTVAVSPAGGFNQTVVLGCSGAPAGATCSLSSDSVTLNGASATSVQVTVATTGNSANLTSPFDLPLVRRRFALALVLPGLSGLMMLGSLGAWRKRRGRMLCGLGMLCLLSVMIGAACGSGSDVGNKGVNRTLPGTYNLSVKGTFSTVSTNLTHSAKLTLVVR